MKILHLIQKPQLRGAEVFASQLSTHINQSGHEAILVTVFDGEAQLPFTGKILSLRGSKRNRLWDIKAWKRLAQIIKDEKPDVIQANAGDTMKYAAMSKMIFKWKQPVYFRNASTISLYIKSAAARKWNSFLFRFADKVISVSNTSAEDFKKLFPEHKNKVTTIPGGIEIAGPSVKELNPEGNPVLIHVGGFTYEKNHKGLINIFELILKKLPSAKLYLLGDGPLKKETEALVVSKNLQQNIKFLGFVPNAMDYIRKAEVLLLPSIIEGLPGVILEAFYCKTPVVAYNTGGIKEIVINDMTGRIVEMNNENTFANEVIAALVKNEENTRMIENAYQLVINNYTNKKIADQFIESYKPKIPVLHIIKSLGRGGAEMLLPETLSKHDRNRYEFHYIYFLPWKNQMVAAIENEGGTVTCLKASNNIKILAKIPKLIKYARRNNIKLIHCHMPWAGLVGRIAGKLRSVPVVYTEHNLWERYHKLTYALNKLSFPYQKKVIAVSDDVSKSISTNYKRSAPDVQVVLNGVNTDKFHSDIAHPQNIRQELNIPANAIVIGIVCVFRAQKRLTTWLEISKQIHDKYPNTNFLIVGDGVLKEEIFQKAKDLNMDKYLRFAGLQAEIRPYLKAMDIFMMSSEFEGLPVALLEAMSMGCMPACTNAGGIPELVADNVNGILVPVSQPMQLVEKISECLDNPERISYFASAARQTVVQQFSMQKMVNNIENIYEEILNLKP